MKPVSEIVKEYVLQTQGRMPETEQEVNDYLDLINHSKEYVDSLEMERTIGVKMMKRLGFKTTDQLKKEFKTQTP